MIVSDPAFRAWRNALRVPNGIDRDELLAAGVILDEDDWQLWTAKGWFAFVTRAAITDAQELALFGLVQERLARQPRLVERVSGDGAAA